MTSAFLTLWSGEILKKKIVLLVHLQIALLLSTSLMAAIEGFEKLMVTAFWLVIIIIHMLNTIACAVSEMFYGDIQGRSYFLPTTTCIKCNVKQ